MPAKRAPTEESIKQENDTTAAEAALKARLSRKRTKTGCLTCRKRRIKCDEERPMCKNCNKSRRLCEGYIQRVVFKTPAFDYTGSTSAAPPSTTLQHASESIAIPGILYQPAPASAFHLHQPTYAPFLPTTQAGTGVNGADHFYPPHQQAYRQLAVHTQRETQFIMVHPAVVHTLPPTAPATLALGSQSISSSTYHTEHVEYPARFTLSPLSASTTATYGPSLVVASTQAPITVSSAVQDLQTAWQTPFDPRNAMPLPSHLRSSSSNSTSLDFTADDFVHSAYLPDSGPTQLLRNAAVETQDDDYYDVDSDDGMNAGPGPHHADHVFSTMIQRQNTTQLKSLRSYDAFLHQGMLDTYRPERVASPLRNETTARVYMHFITATGPSLSPFERSTARSGNAANTPFTQRGIWTHTMPMAALHNQGLLHAMLALASLHIARLQGGSVTPSLQHYAWSLKRIHNVVANPKKRLQLTTIAASMLLGFYEIMTAEHSKWNTHLAGAKQLIMETDFAGMMRQFTVMKRERRIRVQYETAYLAMPPTPKSLEDESLDQIHDIDERIVSRFYGQEIRYDEQGHVEVWTGSIPRLDLGKLEIMKDLFWWYCKQDCYQSIISGNPLLMDYSRWSACPPRAPLGRPDAIYGSFDHLTLLLGRVASFASKDRVRKLKVMEQNGGQWRPHPASHMARAAPPPTAPGQPPPIAPIFYGMAPPPTSKVRMPMSYERLDGKHSPNLEQESWSLEKALQEYEAIRAALDDFKSYLGEGFAPLSDDHHPPVYTSFGSTLFYLSYDIGCMMAIWNMTVIIAIRSHPHYHPAAHVAAGMAIAETAPFATDIGRIAAGIVPGPQQLPLNPFLGASLIESCMPSFFAAVQYQQPEQRHETVMRIFNIARCTGWGTADLIANGCETAWVKAAQAGRGPPYARLVRSQLHDSNDARMNGSWETQDPSVQPDENDEVDRRFIRSSNAAKLFWAVGVVGTEHDM